MKIEVGQTAPEFSLQNQDRETINLTDLKGQNVLLLFYPKAFTSVCTAELCRVRDDIGRYQNAAATVLGISVDPVETLKEYKEANQYNFSLLSDINKEVSTAYGSLYDTGVSKRSAFVIDMDGIVRYAEVLEDASYQPDFDAINQALASLTPVKQ